MNLSEFILEEVAQKLIRETRNGKKRWIIEGDNYVSGDFTLNTSLDLLHHPPLIQLKLAYCDEDIMYASAGLTELFRVIDTQKRLENELVTNTARSSLLSWLSGEE